MIIVDRALAERAHAGRPVRVGIVGAGFMARGLASQIVRATPGMELVVIANRTVDKAVKVFSEAGLDDVAHVSSVAELDAAAAAGRPAVTDDPLLLCHSGAVEALVEVTGSIEYAAHTVVEAIDSGTHVVAMNAELDGTVGPLLARRAADAGVVYTVSDGDQPGVQLNLHRFVRSMGLEPLVCGNVKGLHDPYRNPTTQGGFARRWGQNPYMVTSFADGCKISFEQAVVANATGMTVARRGMGGYTDERHVDECTDLYDIEELRTLGGVVDYLVGAKPAPGVFVYATTDDPQQRHYLNLYKLGEGPLYSFYTPYHLCHFEVPFSVARAVLLGDTVLVATGPMRVEVITAVKEDARAGTVIDGLGGYHTYGLAERADVTARERLLPLGLAEGCTLRRDMRRDEVLTVDDVEIPSGRLIDTLRAEQDQRLPVLVTSDDP